MPCSSATFQGSQPGRALNPNVILTAPAASVGPQPTVSAAQASMTRLSATDGTRKRGRTGNAYSCVSPQPGDPVLRAMGIARTPIGVTWRSISDQFHGGETGVSEYF